MLLVRHAMPSTSGAPARLIGWTDVPLCAQGELQAGALASRLTELQPRTVYTSPLARARQTAEAITRRVGAELVVEERLREIHCGSVEGLETAEVARSHPRLWQRHLAQREDWFRWPGGESYLEFRARCLAALDEIARTNLGALAIVVTHAGVISQVLGTLLAVAPARWECNRPDHASTTTVDWSDSGGKLLAFNCRDHLSDERLR